MIMPILSVKDVRDSVNFYVGKLGFEKDVLFDGPEGQPVFAIVRMGKAVFGLSTAENHETGVHVQFMVYVPEDANIDLLYSQVQQRGVVIKQEIKDGYWGDRTFSVLDPDGYLISMAKPVQQIPNEEIAGYMKRMDA